MRPITNGISAMVKFFDLAVLTPTLCVLIPYVGLQFITQSLAIAYQNVPVG